MQYGDTIVPLSEDHSFSTAREMMRLKAHEMAEVSIIVHMDVYLLQKFYLAYALLISSHI